MKRRLGYGTLLLAVLCGVAAGALQRFEVATPSGDIAGFAVVTLLGQLLLVATVGFALLGTYGLVVRFLLERTADRRGATTSGTSSGSSSSSSVSSGSRPS